MCWHEGAGRLSASLIFGVGLAHETFLESGMTRLVGQFALRPLSGAGYDTTATTDVLCQRAAPGSA